MAAGRMISVILLCVILHCLTSSEATISGNPRNVILVIVKGLSYDSVASARIQEAMNNDEKNFYDLSFEKFPHHGSLKTYDSNFNIGSCLSSNALFCGTYELTNSSCGTNFSLNEESIISHAQRRGKSTGLVTTARLTSELPATLYGVGPGSGVKECPNYASDNCSDASYFLVHGSIGKNIDVILGDGRGILGVDNYEHKHPCSRKDERNLIEEWKQNHPNGFYFNDTVKFVEHNISKNEKVIGILSRRELNEYDDKQKIVKTRLGSIVVKTIQILKDNAKGYFMVVIVDDESLVDAVIMANKMVDEILKEISSQDTLMIITSDYARIKEECKPIEINYTTELITDATTISSMEELNTTYTTPLISTDNNSESLFYNIYNSESLCLEKTIDGYVDVPIYAKGPYPDDHMPATQDQASFGRILQTLIEGKKHLSDVEDVNERKIININSGGPQVEDVKASSANVSKNIFQSDINEVLAEIDDMAKEFFDGWLPSK